MTSDMIEGDMDTVYAYNEVSGVVAQVPERFLTHPILGANLRQVRNGKTRGRLSEIVKSDAIADDITEEDEGEDFDLESDTEEEEED